jgi:formylmethanofuran dehydrogenase subunit E
MASQERKKIDRLSAEAAKLRGHMCVGIPLGVRMGLRGVELMGMEEKESREKLMVVVETNSCAADGIQISTGCTAGGRKLRVFEYGRSAATFYDGETGKGYRVATRPNFMARATELAVEDGMVSEGQKVEESSPLGRKVMMNAFLRLPIDELLSCSEVTIIPRRLLLQARGQPRTPCGRCGEVIMDGKGIRVDGEVLCEPCYHGSYYATV